MANSKIKLNRKIFERLERLLPNETAAISSLIIGEGSIRFINTEDGSVAQDILINAVANNSILAFDKTRLYTISFKGQELLIITGTSESIPFLKGINPLIDPDNSDQDIKNNPGLITFLFSQENFPILDDENIGYQLLDDVFSREGSENGRFEAKDLIRYFTDFSVWELDSNYNHDSANTLYAIYSGFLVSNGRKLNLNFKPETLQGIKLLIEELPIDLIGGNLFRCIVSMEWKHSFLELYQCIEYLFPIPYLLSLSSNLEDTNHFKKLFKHIENDLNWRPKEDQAFERLLKEISGSASISKMHLCVKSIFNLPEEMELEKEINNIAKYIYKTRNSTAHFRSALSLEISNESDWDNIIESLSSIIYDLYIKYATQISSIK